MGGCSPTVLLLRLRWGCGGVAAAAVTVCLITLQLLLLLDRVADGLAFVEKWPTFKETAVYSGRLKQLSQW